MGVIAYVLCMATIRPRKGESYAKAFARAGGKARAQKLTQEQRQEIARKAIQTRWAKAKRGDHPQDLDET